jgi:hypothetical protein
MPPVPSVRGERVVRALEKLGSKWPGLPAATTSCAIPMGAGPRSRYIKVAMWPRERCAEFFRTPA